MRRTESGDRRYHILIGCLSVAAIVVGAIILTRACKLSSYIFNISEDYRLRDDIYSEDKHYIYFNSIYYTITLMCVHLSLLCSYSHSNNKINVFFFKTHTMTVLLFIFFGGIIYFWFVFNILGQWSKYHFI